MKEAIGYFLIALPFAGIFYMQYKTMGLKLTLKTWRDVTLIIGTLTLGMLLVTGTI